MSSFDPSILDENSRAIYDRRAGIGLYALTLGDDPQDETNASDVIADILTAMYGPAATSSFDEGDTRYETRTRLSAHKAAETLLDHALRSWKGDAEDYIEGEADAPNGRCACGQALNPSGEHPGGYGAFCAEEGS